MRAPNRGGHVGDRLCGREREGLPTRSCSRPVSHSSAAHGRAAPLQPATDSHPGSDRLVHGRYASGGKPSHPRIGASALLQLPALRLAARRPSLCSCPAARLARCRTEARQHRAHDLVRQPLCIGCQLAVPLWTVTYTHDGTKVNIRARRTVTRENLRRVFTRRRQTHGWSDSCRKTCTTSSPRPGRRPP